MMERKASSPGLLGGEKVRLYWVLVAAFFLLPWFILSYYVFVIEKPDTASTNTASTNIASTKKASFGELLQNSQSGKRLHKYGYMYAQYLDDFLDKDVRMLEIGLRDGASVDLWKLAFSKIQIYGIDKGSGPTEFKRHIGADNVKIFVGDQEDVRFLTEFVSFVKEDGGLLDFIVDDGGHTMTQQKTSFTHLFPLVKPGGYYFIEDLETSYYSTPCDWGCYGQCCGGGPPGAKGTTVDMIKSFVDVLNSDFHAGPNPKSEARPDRYSVNPVDHLIDTFQCWRNMCMLRRKLEEE